MPNFYSETLEGCLKIIISREGSQGKLARKLEISPGYVNDIVKGRRYLTPKLINKMHHFGIVNQDECLRLHRLGAIKAGWLV